MKKIFLSMALLAAGASFGQTINIRQSGAREFAFKII